MQSQNMPQPAEGVVAQVIIEPAQPEDAETLERLWQASGLDVSGGRAGVCLVARDPGSRAVLGCARYARGFPPHSGAAHVAVAQQARRKGLGTALLRALAGAARRQGVRSLGIFVASDDEASWRLLAASGIPLRLYASDTGYYAELDLAAFQQGAHRTAPPLSV